MTIDQVLRYVIFTLCGVALLFAFAIVMVPSFNDTKAMIVGGVLASLVTMATTLATMSRVQTLDKKNKENDSDAS
jgi:tetrahydromethanopterin S-methyltransferase subunit C